VPTLGTELEYYRSDPAHLEARLALCAAAGYTTIQTYVPWNVHENQRGVLDFTGRTHPVILGDHADEYQIETPDQEVAAGGYKARVIANTDLLGFIRACTRHGFRMILRPGPFISDEWRNGGLPDWLGAAYPNMFMRGPHNTTLEPGFPFSPPLATVPGGGPLYYFAGPSYADHDYLRETRRWLIAFATAVRPFLHSSGGPIVAMQVDDEICFYYRFGPFEVDYHPSMVARFGEVPPTDWPAQGGPVTALRPALRWQRFKAEQLGVFLGAMGSALREGGADVPITHEHEHQLAPPANFSQLARSVDVLHPEFYLDPGPYTVPTIELCAAAIRAAQRERRDVISAEMSGGDVLVRHLLTGEGISGFLGFTYTEGIAEGDVPKMSIFDRTVRLAGRRLTRANRAADAAIVWPSEYLYAPYDSTRYGFERDVRGAIERDIPALAALLMRAGLAFDLLDTDVARPGDYGRYHSIWLACADLLPRGCQRALVEYVSRGGHLICWPAPPTLDENYGPCTVLRDALYPERAAAFYPEDNQTIEVDGTGVLAYRGVQTFALSATAHPFAHRQREPCGYWRRKGRGRASLLGTWPAADSVAGREGDALEVQDVPTGSGAAAAVVLDTLTRLWGPVAAGQVNPNPPPGEGTPTKFIVFDYSNERRGGEVITGGTAAYWDGENVAPIAEIDLGTTTPVLGTSQPEITRPPFRPITAAHAAIARSLHGHDPVCSVSDGRVQARLLRARDSAAATVSLVNRYDQDMACSVVVQHRGQGIRLPVGGGAIALPAGEALLLPLNYELAPRLNVEHATVQLVEAAIRSREVQLMVRSFGGGELRVRAPGRVIEAAVDGRRVRAERRLVLNLAVPPGDREVLIRWRG
jgi:beta-galactosidase